MSLGERVSMLPSLYEHALVGEAPTKAWRPALNLDGCAPKSFLVIQNENAKMTDSPPTRRPQFGLRSLFALTAVVALLLGAWRLFGDRVGLACLGVLIIAAPLLWRPRWFFAWYLPGVWTTVAWNNFAYPGDEYGGFAAGSLAGLWILFFFNSLGDVRTIFWLILAAGTPTMAIAGLGLDKLRAPRVAWLALCLAMAGALLFWALASFPSVDRALAKNGSYEAYILPAVNLGLTAATSTMLLFVGLVRLVQRLRTRFRSAGRSDNANAPG